jgi:hypothetical protein
MIEEEQERAEEGLAAPTTINDEQASQVIPESRASSSRGSSTHEFHFEGGSEEKKEGDQN